MSMFLYTLTEENSLAYYCLSFNFNLLKAVLRCLSINYGHCSFLYIISTHISDAFRIFVML